ncbi:AraC family transcriptional regulator with amidase-like domain [Gemmobacter caeni]|uniref:AraC family transcriptional regulator with amidase-like domain n=1 Tax=Gemmobacter caeni TaxID=589035 RepID=A0A2T6B9H4_9RHOB|nr:DJ-1/PfpI family protein [Gemmobacter caeni]PTX52686.1 AraC family transcriptional regulator with amidase-like domain [Gemmobacter caeni]TWI94859.1 AraC family transcriptional regulator with amidase-like domain [Gemmobacter caeni]
MSKAHRVAIVAMPRVQLLDIAGPLDVFAEANHQVGHVAYELTIVATEAGPICCSSGARLLPDLAISDELAADFDTLLVAGSPYAPETDWHPDTVAWVRRAALTSRRYGSVCSGAFLLAATRLLDGKCATTHWAMADQLARAYPDVQVQLDAIHVRDGKLRTAAGVTAGLDLALALVEEDLGREVAMRVASQLVMLFRRVGGQAQFSRSNKIAPVGRSVLQEIQRWAAANPEADLSVPVLADRAGLSARHFTRLFQGEIGMTPAAWIERLRVDLARQHLETGLETPKQVAALCGFANPDTLRRSFVRHVGITPAEYRRRFATLEEGPIAIDPTEA